MAMWSLAALLLPAASELVPTPHGYRPAECVVEIPDGATFHESGKGLVIEHTDGQNEFVQVPSTCHVDDVAKKMAGRRQLASTSNSSVRQWMDNAGYTYRAGYESFSGNYNIPTDPVNGRGQILYYFIGLENTGDGPVNILQPVLAWQGQWTLASWACCPSNISTTSRTITGLRAGQTVEGNMKRVDGSTWQIDSTINGQTTTLRPRIGSYKYTWADVTLEIYSINSCQQYSNGKVHFTDMSLTGSSGEVVHPSWTQPSGTECQGHVQIFDEKTIDIYHNSAAPAQTLHSTSSPTFTEWAMMHGKSYSENGEFSIRERIYTDNVKKIEAHNAKNLTWSMAVNGFADLTEEEFVAQYTGLLASPPSLADTNFGTVQEVDTPDDEVDWVKNGAVNPIKNQGQCGSCWAFSTVGTLESAYQISTGKLYSLAEQQLVDCDRYNSGCSGGWPHTAYDRYYSSAGVCSESSYRYTARGGSCQASSCEVLLPRGTVTGHQNVGQTSSALKSAVASQPVSVTVNAGQLQFASNGVVTGQCRGQINHAVIAVGYGTDGLDYFKIRNSWGTSWGEAGYIRLAQNGGSQGTACLLQDPPVVPRLSTESVLV